MSIVLDASITLAWLFDDEVTPAIDDIFVSVARSSAVVPDLWHLEVGNGLQVAIRRRRIDRTFRDSALEKLLRLRIEIDPSTGRHAWASTLEISDAFGLTVYDAAYLELARRRNLPLATLDVALLAAAAKSDVKTVGL